MNMFSRVLVPAALALLMATPAAAKKKTKKTRGELVTIQVTDLDAKTKNARVYKLKKALLKIKGVSTARVNKKAQTIVVRIAEPAVRALVTQTIIKHGFTIKKPKKPDDKADDAEDESDLDPSDFD